jgi:hypothetical protein
VKPRGKKKLNQNHIFLKIRKKKAENTLESIIDHQMQYENSGEIKLHDISLLSEQEEPKQNLLLVFPSNCSNQ